MKIKHILFSFCLLIGAQTVISAQSFSLQDIYKNGRFAVSSPSNLRSMNDGEHYTILENDKNYSHIVKYRYIDAQAVDTLFSTKNALQGQRIFSYSTNATEDKILLSTHPQYIFRRSFSAIYYIYDTKSKDVKRVGSDPIQEPLFSPDGTKIAFCKNNNLYYQDLTDGTTHQITSDGLHDHVINGTADWVYEEEFSVVRMFDWSDSGRYLAYVRFDESRVPVYGMDIYNQSTYPARQTFKYPKAGAENSTVSVHIYSLEKDSSADVPLNEYSDFYIPRIKWLPSGEKLSFYVMPRLQNELTVYGVSPSGDDKKILWQDKDDAYINLSDFVHYFQNGNIAFISERDGHAHLYLQNTKGKISPLTSGAWDITAIYGIDEKNNKAYIQTTEQGSQNRTISSLDIKTKKLKRLSKDLGTNSASFSENYKYYINTFSSATSAPLYTLNSPSDGKMINKILDNSAAQKTVHDVKMPVKHFSTIDAGTGAELKMWTMYPSDFDSTKVYPLLMYVYGGPGSQQVLNSWSGSMDIWLAYMAEKGYIVACIDGRGTGGRGSAFEKQIYRQMGRMEIEDQIAAAKKLSSLPYVDASRIGIFGWSFGGYMACLGATRGGDVFKTAVAVAPVTSWRMYDSVYTERYLSTPQENPEGYDKNSPLTYAQDMNVRLMIIHGTADDNVHYQNTLRFTSLLIQNNKPFEQMIYPDKNHSIRGGNTSLHLFTKMTDFLLRNL
ncbi:MAG: S9 family peptidase [Flavobacteriales bacterium]|nr:S9 family peptidase [Flavobacteriales bacterium]